MDSTKTIIFVSGKCFSGKKTFAEATKKIIESKQISVKIHKMLDYIAVEFCNINGLSYDQFINDMNYRIENYNAYINYLRHANLEIAMDKIKVCINECEEDVIIVPDLKFNVHKKTIENELSGIYRCITINIHATDEVRSKNVTNKIFDDQIYESELENQSFMVTVSNKGQVSDLITNAVFIANSYFT
jgi:hypothetical protein